MFNAIRQNCLFIYTVEDAFGWFTKRPLIKLMESLDSNYQAEYFKAIYDEQNKDE